MKQYKYYLFDWDGNLAQTLEVWLTAIRASLDKRNIQVSDEEIGLSFGNFENTFKSWSQDDPEEAFNDAYQVAAQLLPDVNLYPEAKNTLKSLHQQGRKIALVTTSAKRDVERLLERHRITDYFDALVTGHDVANHKPHPEPLEKALELLGGQKSEAVMVGDSDKDLGAALNFGIDSILFYPESHSKFYNLDKLKKLKPTYIIDDFAEILVK